MLTPRRVIVAITPDVVHVFQLPPADTNRDQSTPEETNAWKEPSIPPGHAQPVPAQPVPSTAAPRCTARHPHPSQGFLFHLKPKTCDPAQHAPRPRPRSALRLPVAPPRHASRRLTRPAPRHAWSTWRIALGRYVAVASATACAADSFAAIAAASPFVQTSSTECMLCQRHCEGPRASPRMAIGGAVFVPVSVLTQRRDMSLVISST